MNCGKFGHNNKICTDPIISCGIICFKIDNLFKKVSPIKKIEEYLFNKYIDIEDYNYQNLHFIDLYNSYKNNIKFLLIQRKHSLSFIQFIRGFYNEKNIDDMNFLFELMSIEEVENIKNNDFDFLWNKVWLKTAKSKIFHKEYNTSKSKFLYLKNNNLLLNIKALYSSPEWGFPKGRRNKFENNINCAQREFTEETGVTNYNIFHRINCLEETFIGTNTIEYKHTYYIGGTTENKIDLSILNETYEIGDIGWYTINEVVELIRPYNKTKKDIINQLYFFLNIIIHKIKDQPYCDSPQGSPKKNRINKVISERVSG
jgi:8-oxo-dGTP pyrophosphatase MutT (NUDIX family)